MFLACREVDAERQLRLGIRETLPGQSREPRLFGERRSRRRAEHDGGRTQALRRPDDRIPPIGGSGNRAMFTVRKISYGVGVERIFPIHSPRIDKVEVVSRGRVRRAKLYYLRERSGKAARLQGEE